MEILYKAFNHDLTPRKHLVKVAQEALKESPVKSKHLVGDGLAGVKAL